MLFSIYVELTKNRSYSHWRHWEGGSLRLTFSYLGLRVTNGHCHWCYIYSYTTFGKHNWNSYHGKENWFVVLKTLLKVHLRYCFFWQYENFRKENLTNPPTIDCLYQSTSDFSKSILLTTLESMACSYSTKYNDNNVKSLIMSIINLYLVTWWYKKPNNYINSNVSISCLSGPNSVSSSSSSSSSVWSASRPPQPQSHSTSPSSTYTRPRPPSANVGNCWTKLECPKLWSN